MWPLYIYIHYQAVVLVVLYAWFAEKRSYNWHCVSVDDVILAVCQQHERGLKWVHPASTNTCMLEPRITPKIL